LNGRLHAVSIGKPAERMSNFCIVQFVKTEPEPNFGFPHICNRNRDLVLLGLCSSALVIACCRRRQDMCLFISIAPPQVQAAFRHTVMPLPMPWTCDCLICCIMPVLLLFSVQISTVK